MRVNVYAEELTDCVEIITKENDGHRFMGLRFYLALPVSYIKDGSCPMGRPASRQDVEQADHYQAHFIHRPGDDDSSAVTFWGKTRSSGGLAKSSSNARRSLLIEGSRCGMTSADLTRKRCNMTN